MNIDKKLIEELKTQLSLINYDRNKTLSEQELEVENLLTEMDWLIDKKNQAQNSINQGVKKVGEVGKMAYQQYIKGHTDADSAEVYNSLNNDPSAKNIAEKIKKAISVNDKECWAQYAFNKISTVSVYNDVGYELRWDPLNYIKKNINVDSNPCGMKNVQTIQNKWKSLGAGTYPYTLLKNYPTTENIAKIMIQAKGKGTLENDYEAWVEAAILTIKDKKQWLELTKALDSDPKIYAENIIGIGGSVWKTVNQKATNLGVGNYPYTMLKEKPTASLIQKVIYESMGVITNDKPAWAEAAFNAIVNSTSNIPILYKEVSKMMGQDAYKFVEYYIGSDDMNVKYNEGNYKTIKQCYDIIKSKSQNFDMYYDFTINSDGMYAILDSGNATPNYVAYVLNGSVSTGYETEESGFSDQGLLGSFGNDCESCVVSAFMAIKNKPFYDQVLNLLKTDYKHGDIKSVEEWVSSFMQTDEIYYKGKSVSMEMSRINNSIVSGLVEDSKDKIQIAINEITNKGFGNLTNYEDCKSVNQVYYKAYLYGFKTITEKLNEIRKVKYEKKEFLTVNPFPYKEDLGVLSYFFQDFSNPVKYAGYPSCLEMRTIQLGGSQSSFQQVFDTSKQDLDNKIQITSSSFNTKENIAQDALDNIMTFLGQKDLSYIDKNDPNSGNLLIENTYILQDFVDRWAKIENQYKYHFSVSSTIEDELFPQGPKKFFEYWFDAEDYSTAFNGATLPSPTIFCQANELRSKENLKTGTDALLEESKDALHIFLPVASLALTIFGGGWPGIILGSLLEIADSAIYQFVDEDPYMAGLTLIFAFVGPLDEGLGSLLRTVNMDKFLYSIHKWRMGEEALDEVGFKIMRRVALNAPKYKKLATLSMYNRYFSFIFETATQEGATRFIKLVASLHNLGLATPQVLTKMLAIMGLSFYTWDWIAANVFGLCSEFKFEDALKYSGDDPKAHYWVTNAFIGFMSKLQPFTTKCPDKKPSKLEKTSFKNTLKKAFTEEFIQTYINEGVILKTKQFSQMMPLIQEILKYQGVDKTFNPSNIKHLNFKISSDSWISKILPKGTDCGGIISVLQLDPKDKNKKTGPYNVAIHFSETDFPDLDFFKKGEKVKVQNTSFDGVYEIKNVHIKNKKIVAVTLTIPYKPNYATKTNYDSNFKNRGFVKKSDRLLCLPDITSKKITFTPLFDENMKQAVINYQIKKNIYPFDGEIGKETWIELKKDLSENFDYLMGKLGPDKVQSLVMDPTVFEKVRIDFLKTNPMTDPKKIQEAEKKFNDSLKNNEIMKKTDELLRNEILTSDEKAEKLRIGTQDFFKSQKNKATKLVKNYEVKGGN